MGDAERCPECRAAWTDAQTCLDHFYQMAVWESEHPAFFAEVHHLMVLCYNLQHPSRYSPEGLDLARSLLTDFVMRGVTTGEVRRRNRLPLHSGKRKFKIKGTPSAHGVYEQPVTWTMTVADVTAGGVEGYCENVRSWARAILETLRTSGNLPSGCR